MVGDYPLFEKSYQILIFCYFSHFADINNKATEEVWYRRAVDYYKINPKSFVYSIPFDVGSKKTKVLATHAIMVGKGNEKAPAAVAGVQIDYDIFREMFFNETTKVCFSFYNLFG